MNLTKLFLAIYKKFGVKWRLFNKIWVAVERNPHKILESWWQQGKVPGLDEDKNLALKQTDWGEIDRIIESCQRQEIDVFSWEDEGFPGPLLELSHLPGLVFLLGDWREEVDVPAVAIVGTRGCSSYGYEVAYRLGKELAQEGITVVSGLARGIDFAAHKGALAGGGRTVAALGHGLGEVYPRGHISLAREIVQQGGLVSEYLPGTPALAYHFPERNRIISGLVEGIVVVEAAKRSGALITAEWAHKQGKEVLAVPGEIGRVQSQGPHFLLRSGAKLIEGVEDILEEVYQRKQRCVRRRDKKELSELSEPERHIVQALEKGAMTHDKIVETTGLVVSQVSAVLSLLEIKGWVKGLPGADFALVE